MLVKEQTKNNTKIYHICDAYDISSIRNLKTSDDVSTLKHGLF